MENYKKCDKCDKPATVFVAFIKEGNLVQASYCQEHAIEAGVMDQKGYGMLDSGNSELSPVAKGLTCPACGYSQKMLEERSRLGCPKCYETFAPILNAVIKRIQSGDRHAGKVPRSKMDSTVLHDRLSALQEELQRAIKTEAFEEAASVRDRIADIKSMIDQEKH